MTTFSQLVDDIVTELLRPDLRDTIATYANQTVRDIHFRPSSNSPILYDENRFEEALQFTTDGTWLWKIPSVTRFQGVESVFLDSPGIYVPPRNPKVALQVSDQPWADVYQYRSGPYITIHGVFVGGTGKMSYHMFPRTLAYKKKAERLIRFDADLDAYVLADGSEPTEAQLELETHWVLQRWADTVKEGVRAKAWKRLGEMERTRLAFSAFESMRTGVWNSEPSS